LRMAAAAGNSFLEFAMIHHELHDRSLVGNDCPEQRSDTVLPRIAHA
jgi:hypothetical protein